MDETKFLELSQNKLLELADLIENSDKNSTFDIEYSDGILNIEIFEKNQTYVINKHSASQKIWFSSPISGASYFSYNPKTDNWLNKDAQELSEILLTELKENFNYD